MKVLKIVFVSILGLFVVIFLGLFIFLKTFDVNKYLPQITQQIGQSINRTVSINHVDLGLSLAKGLTLNLKDLVIKDDEKFSKNDFLTVKSVYLGLDIMPLVLQRQVHVTSVVVSFPSISIVRSAEGQINAQTMVPSDSTSKPLQTQTAEAPKVEVKQAAPAASSLPDVSIKSILIENGVVLFEDKNPQMPIKINIDNIEVKVNDFSLTKSFPFTAHLDVLAKGQKNIDIAGRCVLDLSKNAVSVTDLNIKSDLSQLDLSKVKSVTTILQSLPVWPQEVKGNLLIEIPQLNASSTGLDKLSLKMTLDQGYVKLKELLNPIKDININVSSDLKDLILNSFQASAGGGQIAGKANIHDLLTAQTYDFQLETKGINIDELLDESSWPAILKAGFICQLSGSGTSFAPEPMMKNLKADGSFSLTNAKIEKLNILEVILSKLNVIPGLGNVIESALSSSLKDKLNSDTTVLDKAEGKIKVQDKVISLENADIESKLFTINAQGQVGFDLVTDLSVKTYLASDISADLTKSARPLKGLLDDRGRLYIPGKVTGKAPSVGYSPEIDYISKKVLTEEGTEQINKQLDKVLQKNPQIRGILNSVLGGGQQADQTTTNSEAQPTDTQDQNQGDSTKKFLNNALKNILH
jgi:hypothetical protein